MGFGGHHLGEAKDQREATQLSPKPLMEV
jgi:hypothetical protein